MPRLKLYRPRPWDRDGLACGLFPMPSGGQTPRLAPRRGLLAWLLGLKPRRRPGRRLRGLSRPRP